jgi:uroporphyrinogen-III decarboxylase
MTAKRLETGHGALAITRTLGVRRDEYLDHMTFRTNARPLFTELFGPIIGLKEEWTAQGATPQELDFSAFRFRAPLGFHVPVNTGWIGGCDTEVLEETADHVIARDAMGRRVKLCKGVATIPLPLDYPVRTMDDWRRIKSHYAFSEARFQAGWETAARTAREAGQVVTVGIPGGFDQPRQLLGEEALCMAYYDQPDLVHDMLATIGDTAFQVLERVTRTVPVDVLSVHEDMAGKSGSLAGPAQIREFIRPYYRRLWDLAHDRGARLFDQDSDGNMNGVIEAFLECGVNCMHPMEPAAGMDVVAVRERYGRRLAFCGGIDKHVLRRSQDAIVAELEYKVPPLVRSGGCMLSLDHRIPNGTPLANYRFYHRTMWQILERETAALTRTP